MAALTTWIMSGFVIFWAMIGYPVSLKFLSKIIRKKPQKAGTYEPTVTVLVAAHNEEKVIRDKLENLSSMDYPEEKLDVIVASDYSTDRTDEIVKEYISAHKDRKIRLHQTEKHMGKTNAQNEAQKLVDSEILVLTDANAMFDKEAIRQLTSSFMDEAVAYVSGRLQYVNADSGQTASSEGFYWKLELEERKIESDIQTITAGNGAIYACRNGQYKVIDPIQCHDLTWPLQYALDGKRAVYNPEAVAYEKAGECDEDEFKRKVRMSRGILKAVLPDVRILNVFKYGWFTYFYLGHRTARYLLWLAHVLLLLSNIVLAFCHKWARGTLCLQGCFYGMALMGKARKKPGRLERISWYYLMTVLAQLWGVRNILTGKARPTWEKAESTR